jgi:hypothetical protein
MDKPAEQEKTLFQLLAEARDLWNAYARAKTGFTGSAGQEMRLTGALAPLLSSSLEVHQAVRMNTQCEAERALLRQYAGELTRIYGEEK